MTHPQQPYPPQPPPGAGQPWPGSPGGFQQPAGPPLYGYATPYAATLPPPGYGRPPTPVTPSGQPLAEFSDRLLARLIDGAILGGVSVLLAIPAFIAMFALMTDQLNTEYPDATSIMLEMFAVYGVILVLALAAGYVYEVEMMFRTGQTVGKRVMKITTVSLDGTPMNRGIAVRRWLAYHGPSIVPGYSLLDGLWQLWDTPWRQCLHDKFATTTVVKCQPTTGAV